MTKDEALKMAIERLEVFQMGFGGLTDVIQACKEALAHKSLGDFKNISKEECVDYIEYLRKEIDLLRFKEQPAQEPVISNEQYLDLLYEYCKLKADNERLRDALERLAKLGNEPNYGNSIGNDIAKEALSATPAQSLQAHDNEVIEKCAVRGRLAQLENKVVDIEIRALKGEQNAI